MEAEKLSFADCLAEAQRLGYAEADPTFDIGGFDTAHKLAILTSLAFGTKVDAAAVGVEGIETITLADLQAADDLGFRVKLLGVAKRTASGIEQRVHPTMVPKSSAIAQVMDVTNAVVVNADAVREITLSGPGAGGLATASAVVADIADVARGDRAPAFGLPVSRCASWSRPPSRRTRAVITSVSRCTTGPAPLPPSRCAWRRRAFPREHRAARAAARRRLGHAGAGDFHYPRDAGARDPRGHRRRHPGRSHRREAAGYPHRTRVGALPFDPVLF